MTPVLEIIRAIALFVVILSSLAFSAFVLISKKGFTRQRVSFFVLALGLMFISYLAYNVDVISPADQAQIMLTLGLVAVTGLYAFSAHKQAEANVKMAEETREQRIMESRPVIIQKAMVETETKSGTHSSKDWFSYFEIYNAGNGPAIEIEISLLNKDKDVKHSKRKTLLRADEAVQVSFDELAKLEKTNYYIVSEYQSIYSRGSNSTWYQTWLPFKTAAASEIGEIHVIAGELEFREVSKKERLDAFASTNKPK